MIKEAKIFQRHVLLRTYGEDGHVLPICLEASKHFDVLFDLIDGLMADEYE